MDLRPVFYEGPGLNLKVDTNSSPCPSPIPLLTLGIRRNHIPISQWEVGYQGAPVNTEKQVKLVLREKKEGRRHLERSCQGVPRYLGLDLIVLEAQPHAIVLESLCPLHLIRCQPP